VLVLLVAILLALISVAAFPCWSYSARWSHLPSVIAGTLLLCVAIVAVGGKSTPKAAEPDMEVASASPVTSAYNAFHRKIETVILERKSVLR
jgi:hypothetical protein